MKVVLGIGLCLITAGLVLAEVQGQPGPMANYEVEYASIFTPTCPSHLREYYYKYQDGKGVYCEAGQEKDCRRAYFVRHYCPLNLPDGAIVTEVAAYPYKDTSKVNFMDPAAFQVKDEIAGAVSRVILVVAKPGTGRLNNPCPTIQVVPGDVSKQVECDLSDTKGSDNAYAIELQNRIIQKKGSGDVAATIMKSSALPLTEMVRVTYRLPVPVGATP